jgi:hypothetical protein
MLLRQWGQRLREMTGMRKRTSELVEREVDDELLLLDTRADLIHRLNPTAAFIWRTLDDAESPEHIASLLAQRFDVPESVAQCDAIATVNTLRTQGLLV